MSCDAYRRIILTTISGAEFLIDCTGDKPEHQNMMKDRCRVQDRLERASLSARHGPRVPNHSVHGVCLTKMSLAVVALRWLIRALQRVRAVICSFGGILCRGLFYHLIRV
jgi:hypothetical protein